MRAAGVPTCAAVGAAPSLTRGVSVSIRATALAALRWSAGGREGRVGGGGGFGGVGREILAPPEAIIKAHTSRSTPCVSYCPLVIRVVKRKDAAVRGVAVNGPAALLALGKDVLEAGSDRVIWGDAGVVIFGVYDQAARVTKVRRRGSSQ